MRTGVCEAFGKEGVWKSFRVSKLLDDRQCGMRRMHGVATDAKTQ